MADISLEWGGDLTLGPTNDAAMVSGIEEGRQRVLRRLLTAQKAYIWDLTYGASLPEMIGKPVDVGAIESDVRQQMDLEACVALDPVPIVQVTTDNAGGVLLTINYWDSGTGEPVAIGPADGLSYGVT